MNSSSEAKTPASLPDQTDVPFANRLSLLLFVFLVALFAATRLWGLTASCLWFDEIFSVHAARHSWPDLMHFVAADIIHPPLFYVLLKVWINVGGESLLWLRLFPAILHIAAIIPFFLFCRQLRVDSGAITLALLLIAVNGYLIKYAQELRMYSLLFFLSLCSLWLFVKFLRAEASSKKNLLALFAINLLLVYTHYSGWLFVGLQAVVLLIGGRSKVRSFLGAAAALVLAYLPWIYEVMKVSRASEPGKGLGQNIGWVTRPLLMDVVQYFTLLNKPFLFRQSTAEVLYDPWNTCLALVLIGLPLIAFSWKIFGRRTKENRACMETTFGLFIFAFVPVILVFLLSWLLPYSIWGTRHLIIAAGPYSIVAALALRRLRPYWIKTTVYLVLGCWFTLAGTFFLFSPSPHFIWCAWEPLAQEMMAVGAASNDAVKIYAYEDLVAYHLWFILDADNRQRFKITVVNGVPGVFEDPAYFLPRNFSGIAVQDRAALKGDHIWIAFRAQQWAEKSPSLDYLLAAGYHVGRVLERPAQGQKAFLVELWRK